MKSLRKPISKKIRFDVFKRDFFTCQYCSAKPPKAPLEIDHLIPICKGGDNNIDNLITACFDCNRGKAGSSLNLLTESLISKTESKRIALNQYKEYQKLLKLEKLQIDNDVALVENIYSNVFDNYEFTPSFKIKVKRFINAIGIEKTLNAMEIACLRMNYENSAIRYFCGICWKEIKG